MIEISGCREEGESSWSGVPRGAALVGGYVWRCGWGREAQQRGRSVWEKGSYAERPGLHQCRGREGGQRKHAALAVVRVWQGGRAKLSMSLVTEAQFIRAQ